MDLKILKNYSVLNPFYVSRETCLDFETLIENILTKNKEINLISNKSAKNNDIRERHIIDSAQIIEFIDLNDNTTCDLGSGNGFPALVIAIIAKNMKKNIKIIMHEKSPNKCRFLKDVSNDLGLQTKIIQEDIFKLKNIKTGTVMSRAFKPLPIILELIYQNFSSYKNIILFMGENGNKLLNQALLKWDIEFVKKKSLTNRNSFLLNIKKLRKLN